MSTQKSISGIIGKGSLRHNNREFYAANVDKARTKDNITICKEDIRATYHDLFDEALKAYNAKQKRKDRRIPDYYEHIRLSKQEKLFYEVIFQVGDMKDTAVGSADGEQAAKILKRFYEQFCEENPHIHVFNAVIHMDEATPHLHIDFIPVATENKRGLSTKNSLSKALEQQGFKGEGKFNTCTKLWIDSEKERLAKIMEEHGIAHEVKGIHRSSLSVEEYKLRERMKEVAVLDEQISKKDTELNAIDSKIADQEKELEALSDKKKKVKAIDKIQAEKAVFSDKVKLSSEDYDSLVTSAKRYHTHKSKEQFLAAKVTALEQENSDLKQEISEKDSEISKLKSFRERFNIANLQREVEQLKKKLNKVMEFLDIFGLREKFEQYLQSDKKRTKQQER